MRGKVLCFCPGCARERLRLEIFNVLFAGRPAILPLLATPLFVFHQIIDYIFTLWAKRPQT